MNNAFQNNGSNGNAELRIGNCNDFVVKNNIFKGENKIHAASGNSNIDYTHNYQFGSRINSDFINCENCIETGIIDFLNTDISATSPYITNYDTILKNTGITVSEVNDDYLGLTRPYDDFFDIGAYELRDGDACEITTWYADTDEDGFGDNLETILACEQPQGYVAQSGDLCPNDTQKTSPGECGCLVSEGTCNETGDVCDSPDYNSATVYALAGTTVIYNGNVYENKWYTQGQLPTSGGPWELITFCNPELTDCASIKLWSPSTIYATTGTQVVYNQNIYENRWYIEEGIPGKNSAWQMVGFCASANALSANTSFQVSVHDLSGNSLLNTQTDSTNIDDLDMSILESGIYIIHFTNLETGNTTVKKISK